MNKLTGRGGPGRGQGRKPTGRPKTKQVNIRLPDDESLRLKLKMLGGGKWMKEQIEKAPAPPGYYAALQGGSASAPAPQDAPAPPEALQVPTSIKTANGATLHVPRQVPVTPLPDNRPDDSPF